MAGSKKAVRAALREEKRKRLGEDKDVIDEAAVEEEEEDGACVGGRWGLSLAGRRGPSRLSVGCQPKRRAPRRLKRAWTSFRHRLGTLLCRLFCRVWVWPGG